MQLRKLATYVVANLMLVVSVQSAAATQDWSYQGATGPEHWGTLAKAYSECATGKQQSPIDILNTSAVINNPLTINYQSKLVRFINAERKLSIDANEQDIAPTLHYAGKKYQLLQFHLHHPSEHLLKGKRYPAEMHFVHQRADKKLAVIGVFIQQGKANEEFAKILAQATREDPQLDLQKLLPASKSYYQYPGSLTTPPCTEDVQWLVMAQPITLTKAQLKQYFQRIPENARPVQPLNNRTM